LQGFFKPEKKFLDINFLHAMLFTVTSTGGFTEKHTLLTNLYEKSANQKTQVYSRKVFCRTE
jgi:hypothetical protein